MLVLLLIVLSLQRVKFFYFVHRFREFCECFVVFFDKHIFFLWASCLSSLLLLLGVLFLLVVFHIQVGTYVCMYVMYVCVCVCMYVCICMCVYVCMYVCIITTTEL